MNKNDLNPRAVLAQNLQALMDARVPNSQIALAKKSGVAQATIGRVLRKETAATIETVGALAGAYGLQPWQLVVAGMDPANPPTLRTPTAQDKAIFERLKSTVEDMAKTWPK